MNSKKKPMRMLPAVLLIVGVALLGGCTEAAPVSLEVFVADILRNAAAALLL